MEIKPSASWKGLAGKLRGRVSVFIGMSDAGKTTLIRYLAERLLSMGEPLALVDSDIGQSSVGPPGTVSMRTFASPGAGVFEARLGPERIVFVGTTNPARNIPAVVEAARRMVEAAKEAGAGTILIDTSGLVQGGLGKALKLAKIRAIGPEAVVVLERERGELEHIVSRLESVRVYRLRASRHARRRTALQRKRNRAARLEGYLGRSRMLKLKTGRPEFLSVRGERVDLDSLELGTVVALNREEETLALGVYMGMEGHRALIRTPLDDARGLRKVIIGEMKLDYA